MFMAALFTGAKTELNKVPMNLRLNKENEVLILCNTMQPQKRMMFFAAM